MPLPVTFATLPTGNNPASLLDTEFLAVANMGTTYCTATGTNTILLSVAPNQPTPTGYANGQQFSFLAPASNTGPVTIQVGSLAAIPLRSGGSPLVAGALVAGTICDVVISGTGTTADLVGGPFLPIAGGQVNGTLTISATGSSPLLLLNKSASGFADALAGQTAGSTRWVMTLGNAAPESPTANGSDFTLARYDNTATLIDQPLTITRSSGAVTMRGSATNDSAAAGYVGEYIQSVVLSPGVTLTTATAANVTSISLTAGDWDVVGEVWFSIGAGGATSMISAVNTASATVPPAPGSGVSRTANVGNVGASTTQIQSLTTVRLSLAATTSVYLVAYAAFPSGTTTAYGRLGARRAR